MTMNNTENDVKESGRDLIEGAILAGRNEDSYLEPPECKSQVKRVYSEGTFGLVR
jgi:hypothetical protein